MERIISNACYAVRYCNACKPVARSERFISNACNAVTNYNACKLGATSERTLSNACNAVWDSNACKPIAPSERIISNACHAVRDYGVFTTGNKSIGFCFYNRITIFSAVIFCIVTIHNNACKAGAITERPLSNACNAIRNYYACKAGAIRERLISNACNAVTNYNACKAGAIIECIISNACYVIGCSVISNKLWNFHIACVFVCSRCHFNSLVLLGQNVIIDTIDLEVVGCCNCRTKQQQRCE